MRHYDFCAIWCFFYELHFTTYACNRYNACYKNRLREKLMHLLKSTVLISSFSINQKMTLSSKSFMFSLVKRNSKQLFSSNNSSSSNFYQLDFKIFKLTPFKSFLFVLVSGLEKKILVEGRSQSVPYLGTNTQTVLGRLLLSWIQI